MEQKKVSFTPGPWRPGKTRGCVVADSDIGTHSGDDNRSYYGGALVCESVATEANEHLIAAAPDLLTACELLVATEVKKGTDYFEAIVAARWKAREAIAKAKGELTND